MNKIAVFDFDKTIVSKDTYEEFLKFLVKRSIFRSAILVLLFPIIGTMFFLRPTKLFAINTLSAVALIGQKESLFRLRGKFLSYFYNSVKAQYFPAAIEAMEHHRSLNHEILILSGCPTWLLKSALRKEKIQNCRAIGSKQVVFFGYLKTTDYCYSKNKLKLVEQLGISTSNWCAGYSDSMSDLAFLERCQKQYIVNANQNKLKLFRKKLGSSCSGVVWA